MKIGILSDTHGYLDDRIHRFFSDCEHIFHAGDIGSTDVLNLLRPNKTLHAVYGNIDGNEIRYSCPEFLFCDLEGIRIYMRHIGGHPKRYNLDAYRDLLSLRPQLFIAGHSHILRVEYDKQLNCLFINPGAYGKYGFHKVRTAVRVDIINQKLQNLEVLELTK